MHHDASWDAPKHLLSNHMQSTSMGAAKALFAGISWMHVRKGSMEVTQSEIMKWKEQ
jgi:hypothetical protein